MSHIKKTKHHHVTDIKFSPDKRLNVAFVITRSDVIGGAQVHVRDLALRLLNNGHNVTVLFGGEGPLTADFDRLHIPWISIPALCQALHPIHDVMAFKELLRALWRLHPDIVSAHTAKAGIMARFACFLLRIPVVFTAHGWSINPDRFSGAKLYLFRFIERLAGRYSDRIINVCSHERNLALNNGIASAEKLSIIHNGMPDIASDLMACPAIQPPRIIMVARMDEQKDHVTLLKGVSKLTDLEWKLDLIGDGPLSSSVRQLVCDLSLTERVRFLGDGGWCVDSYLAAVQIFVLTSHFEGFPRCIIEAMRAGLPVIATDVSGVREAVENGKTGFLLPKCGVDVLRDRLQILIVDPSLRLEMGSAARRRYLSEFTFEKMYQRTESLYHEILRRRKVSIY